MLRLNSTFRCFPSDLSHRPNTRHFLTITFDCSVLFSLWKLFCSFAASFSAQWANARPLKRPHFSASPRCQPRGNSQHRPLHRHRRGQRLVRALRALTTSPTQSKSRLRRRIRRARHRHRTKRQRPSRRRPWPPSKVPRSGSTSACQQVTQVAQPSEHEDHEWLPCRPSAVART